MKEEKDIQIASSFEETAAAKTELESLESLESHEPMPGADAAESASESLESHELMPASGSGSESAVEEGATRGRSELVASAMPDGGLTVTAAGMEGFIRAEEAEAQAREAYLRGRNEAIEENFGSAANIHHEISDTQPETLDALDDAGSLADIFTFRTSVWG